MITINCLPDGTYLVGPQDPEIGRYITFLEKVDGSKQLTEHPVSFDAIEAETRLAIVKDEKIMLIEDQYDFKDAVNSKHPDKIWLSIPLEAINKIRRK